MSKLRELMALLELSSRTTQQRTEAGTVKLDTVALKAEDCNDNGTARVFSHVKTSDDVRRKVYRDQ
jgi:hypothetical protein